MTAIITDPLKRQLTQTIFNEVTAQTARYYIGIGRSEAWDSAETVPTPIDNPRSIRNARASMQSIKTAGDVTFTIPRYNWSSGAIYNGYDDNLTEIPATNQYYVLTEDNQVYIVLQGGKDANGNSTASTVKPTGTSVKPFKTADGYVWKFLFALSATRASKFLSANFVPVEKILDSAGSLSLSSLEAQQASVQDAASAGQIIGVSVTAGGSGYTSPPTVTIDGDGKAASATATVFGGAVVKIELDSSADSAITMGHGYNFASVSITGGGGAGAVARAIIGPDSGIGADCRNELKATSLMFNTKPAGTETGDFVVGNDFRQIVLMRNPRKGTVDSDFTAATGRVLKFLQVTSNTDAANFTVDTEITGGSTGAKAYVDDIDSDKVYYHQSEETGFKPFQEGEAISGGGNSANLVAVGVDADSDAFTRDDVLNTSGEILYIENRAPVVRASNQTEDIKIVVTL